MGKKIEGREYKVTENNIGSCIIDDFVQDCGTIWTKDLERPVFDLYYHLVLHASKLGEALRRQMYDDAIHELGRTTIWLLSFINKIQNVTREEDGIFSISKPLSQIIWEKYPNCCPVCFGEKIIIPEPKCDKNDDWKGTLVPCQCLRRLSHVETRDQKLSESEKKSIKKKLIQYAQKNKPTDPNAFSLNWFQDMFEKIYAANIFTFNIEAIGFHLLEEIGE